LPTGKRRRREKKKRKWRNGKQSTIDIFVLTVFWGVIFSYTPETRTVFSPLSLERNDLTESHNLVKEASKTKSRKIEEKKREKRKDRGKGGETSIITI
jgi:ribosomal protein S8E